MDDQIGWCWVELVDAICSMQILASSSHDSSFQLVDQHTGMAGMNTV